MQHFFRGTVCIVGASPFAGRGGACSAGTWRAGTRRKPCLSCISSGLAHTTAAVDHRSVEHMLEQGRLEFVCSKIVCLFRFFLGPSSTE